MLLLLTGGERDNRRRSSGGREDPRHVKLRAVKQMLAEVRRRDTSRVALSVCTPTANDSSMPCELFPFGEMHLQLLTVLSVQDRLFYYCRLNTAMTQQYTPVRPCPVRWRTQTER